MYTILFSSVILYGAWFLFETIKSAEEQKAKLLAGTIIIMGFAAAFIYIDNM